MFEFVVPSSIMKARFFLLNIAATAFIGSWTSPRAALAPLLLDPLKNSINPPQ